MESDGEEGEAAGGPGGAWAMFCRKGCCESCFGDIKTIWGFKKKI